MKSSVPKAPHFMGVKGRVVHCMKPTRELLVAKKHFTVAPKSRVFHSKISILLY
ncbi:hypothetical protein AXF42_Ash020335 [Apostasia shenzhenica]|uniref:Uncharacterized protein n=1 Tax=Apostasia shenzhenica TaxID=1088818 RepID=A0A2I0B0Q5_9ASPA|nr:hypothetical protein AXF42_Ash020335 [Apostasia shenzhenica]